jgi:carbamoyl-phosphate synthase small subunit
VKGLLVLEDGTAYTGDAIGRPGTSFGEIVFNTAMSGYQEVLTDPSYAGQIVVMTAAHVGNYGVNREEAESDRIHVAGFVARDFPRIWSGTEGEESLADYLVPTSCDLPNIELIAMHTPNRRTPAGTKGMAEGGVMGAMGAVANAVNHALSTFGVVADRLPLSPEYLRALLRGRV